MLIGIMVLVMTPMLSLLRVGLWSSNPFLPLPVMRSEIVPWAGTVSICIVEFRFRYRFKIELVVRSDVS